MTKTGKIFLSVVIVLVLVAIAFVVKGQLTPIPVVTWTMPGDPQPDSLPPVRVAGHELRYSTDSVLVFSDPIAAPVWVPMPPPLDPGVKAVVTLSGLAESRKYWLRYRAVDSTGHWSAWSNIAIKIGADATGPTAVTDLR
jgi:hypothetical protein